MSLAQLVQVKLPELSTQVAIDLKAPEKPSEDFLAVLDRALSDSRKEVLPPNDNSSRPVANDTRRPEQTDAPTTALSQNETARLEQQLAENAAQGKVADSQRDNRRASEHTVTTLAKQKDHSGNTDKAQTLQKDRQKTKLQDPARADQSNTVNFHQTGAGELQRQTDARNAQVLGKATEVSRVASDNPEIIKSRKINTKTTEAVVQNDAKPAQKNAKAPTAGDVGEQDAKLKSAAARMQLHADTGTGTSRALQSALDVVKNIAQGLGMEKTADPSRATGKVIELSRNGTLSTEIAKHTGQSKAEMAAVDTKKKTEDAPGLRQSDRFGKKDSQDALAQARESGRVQVLDLRNSLIKGSPVLESLVASANGAPASDSRNTENLFRKDSFTVLNSSYLPAQSMGNSVTIPMHLVGTQSGNLQQSIRNHLIEKGNSEIVQQARFVMKGQDSGEIRLILKPEALGEVRIHLQMNDGHIAGKIFVENKEVQAAFQDNMDALMQAFQDGGLTTGSMQVAVDSRGSGQSGFAFQEKENDAQQKKYAVGRLENSVATVSAAPHEYSQVNLVV